MWKLLLMQRFIFSKIRNCQTERINLNKVIAHRIAESENKVSGVLRAFDLAAVERRFIDQLILDGGLVRGGAEVLDVNAIDFHFLLGGGTGEKIVNGLVFGPGGEDVVRKLRVHEQQGAAEVVADGQLVAAVIQAAKLGQKIFDFLFLGLVIEIIVFDDLGASDSVNADVARMKAVDFLDGDIRDVKRAGAE